MYLFFKISSTDLMGVSLLIVSHIKMITIDLINEANNIKPNKN